MLLIDAVYIWTSGGKRLLDLLISQFEEKSSLDDIVFLIDNRMKECYIKRTITKIKFEFLTGSEFARYKYYSKNKNTFRKVLCFANVPPPIRLDCAVITYFQNVLLLDHNLQKCLPLKMRILFIIKGYIIKHRLKNTDRWIVQTEHVKELLVKYLNPNVDQIKIIPFFNNETQINLIEIDKKENAFFYPAIGAAHKNHDRLLQAWRNLYRKGKIKYDLHITIDIDATNELYSKTNKLQAEGVPIINHGYLSKTEVDKLYAECKFVIHPSLGESFGLVLVEAIKNDCILLASDLPYVNSIVKSDYLFNPYSIESMEDAIIQAVYDEKITCSKILIKNELEKLINCILSNSK